MQIQVIFSFTRDTFESHILIQCCPEKLKFIKIDESTALIHGPEYPGKQFIQAIIINAGKFSEFESFFSGQIVTMLFLGISAFMLLAVAL